MAEALAPCTQTPIGPPPDEEMPRLSPAALGLTVGEAGGSSVSAPAVSSGEPSSGQRKSWQVPTSSGARPPSSARRPGRPAGPHAADLARPRRAEADPAEPAQPVGPRGPRRRPAEGRHPGPARAAAPRPAPDDEGEPWQQLAPDTDEIAARADTPPRRSRKPGTAVPRRRGGARLRTLLEDRKRVLIVVAAVAGRRPGIDGRRGHLGLLPRQHDAPGPDRQAAAPVNRFGSARTRSTRRSWRRSITAVPGDHIIVQGPDHEEELVFDSLTRALKNLTIESEGAPVRWRTPKATKEPTFLISLRGVDGLDTARLHLRRRGPRQDRPRSRRALSGHDAG